MWYHTNVLGTGPSWPWSYGSCIYNYLCSQCLSPLMLFVRISSRARCTCTASCDKLVSDLRQVGGFLRVLNDIAEILLKVALTTIRHTSKQTNQCLSLLCNISWSTASMIDRGYFLTCSYLMAFNIDMVDTFLIIQFLKYSTLPNKRAWCAICFVWGVWCKVIWRLVYEQAWINPWAK